MLCDALLAWDLEHLLGAVGLDLTRRAMERRRRAETLRASGPRRDIVLLDEVRAIRTASHMLFRGAAGMEACAVLAGREAAGTGPQGGGVRLRLVVAHLCGDKPSRLLRAASAAAGRCPRACLLAELAEILDRPLPMTLVHACKARALAAPARCP